MTPQNRKLTAALMALIASVLTSALLAHALNAATERFQSEREMVGILKQQIVSDLQVLDAVCGRQKGGR